MRSLTSILLCLSFVAYSVGDSVLEHTSSPSNEPPVLGNESTAVDQVSTNWIEQKLDNFNEKENRTWKMRYMANGEHYRPGGPIFIFVGGEWDIDDSMLLGGHLYDMAKEHNAYLFYTEHRYYGESRPTKDLSTENLKYLNVKQALADLAHFIEAQKTSIVGASKSKIVLVGISYSGALVTWFKRLYPTLVSGCWASSAPLLAKLDFYEYKEISGQSIRRIGGDDCYDRIEQSIAEIEQLFRQQRGVEAKNLLNICADFDESNILDVWALFSEIYDIFGLLVQRHKGARIQNACDIIADDNIALFGFANFLYPEISSNHPGVCLNLTYSALISNLTEIEYTGNMTRQWYYQMCNEFGWFQTTTSRQQPFGTKTPLEFYTKLCADLFGEVFTQSYIEAQVNATNAVFGGLNPQAENVYMTHGSLDPWHAVGIRISELVTLIPDYAHCKDLGSITSMDSEAMRASKEKIAQLVRQWVAAK